MNKEFNKQYQMYKSGQITIEEWTRYCSQILMSIMQENAEVLRRLKEEDYE